MYGIILQTDYAEVTESAVQKQRQWKRMLSQEADASSLVDIM